MSPEQARGEAVDFRTDIWSLGIAMYEMITGRLPFKGDNTQSILYSVMNEEPRSLKDLRSEIPPE
jgi:serine/threonine protein kinase